MKQIHLFTSNQKIESFGYGEWVEEPDLVCFEHLGFECNVKREYAGHLCGYICIPEGNTNYGKCYDDIDIDVHGGITFGKFLDNSFWIGFDCAHSGDYVPGLEFFKKTIPSLIIIEKELQELAMKWEVVNKLFEKKYRNIQFCIDQCKSMAEQLEGVKK